MVEILYKFFYSKYIWSIEKNKFYNLKYFLVGNPDLEDNDILVLALDVCNINLHQEAFETIIKKFGKV